MFRDIHKDYKYFEDYLNLTKTHLEWLENKLNEEGANVTSIHNFIASSSQKMVNILYSMGESTDDVYVYYEKWVKNFAINPGSKDYVNLFQRKDLFSLGVLFEDKKENFLDDLNKIGAHYGKNLNPRDASSFIFLDYLNGEELDRKYSSCFKYFDKIVKSEDKQTELASVVKIWYGKQRESGCHDAHKHTENRGYAGYWNFECAALAKIYGIPDEQFKDAKYYPYDLSQRNPIVKNEKYADMVSAEKPPKKRKKNVKFALDKKEENGYDNIATIAKLAYIVSNGRMAVVEDFELLANDYDKFLLDNKIWCDEILSFQESEEEQKMLIFAYWLTGFSVRGAGKKLLKFGAFVDWKESMGEVITQLEKANKNLKYDIFSEEFEFEEDEEDEDLEVGLKKLAEFFEKHNYALLYLDTDSDCYHLFVVRLSDVNEVLELSESIGFKFIKL